MGSTPAEVGRAPEGEGTSVWAELCGRGRGGVNLTKIPVVPRPFKRGLGNSWAWKFGKRSLCRAGRRSDSGPWVLIL